MVLGQIGNPDELRNLVINQRSGPPPLLLRETKDWVFGQPEKLPVMGIDKDWLNNVSAKVRTKNHFITTHIVAGATWIHVSGRTRKCVPQSI